MIFDRSFLKNYGWSLLIVTILFSAIGLLNLYSSSYLTGLVNFKKQIIWIIIGLITMISISYINPDFFKRNSHYIYVLSILSLILVIILGKTISGSKSWFAIGPISIQPSEFSKIALILIIAKFFNDEVYEGPYSLYELLKPIFYLLILFILIMLQPDLGTGLILFLVASSIFAFTGIKKKSLIISFLVIFGLSFPTWQFFLKDYQKERINTFINPSIDPLGTGYNSIQSQIAVGSGKFMGKGFISGSQSQLRFIPAQQTDFAFSVLAEEWGFVGSIFTLSIYFLLILILLDTASSSKNKFNMIVSFGISTLFFWHAAINVGMVIGLLPVTGVPLFLFSYGGSSTLTAFIGLGLVLGIRNRQ
ncbi:MAG: rod shape-determining protein RodA, partial [Candidatus Dadabacteria bacterium]|nr:rod shape-determining protein RodA [Candidatus Dadabacteria bacterium]NIQ14166.1 rod shape-determining protein RodA [Candidatus Dadabacteria bacterium]